LRSLLAVRGAIIRTSFRVLVSSEAAEKLG